MSSNLLVTQYNHIEPDIDRTNQNTIQSLIDLECPFSFVLIYVPVQINFF